MISIVQLGRVPYAEGLELQKKLGFLRQEQRIGDLLLLLEHPPVLTLGRNANRGNVLASEELLSRRGIALVETDRGGDVTYHGPGQLVGYPIFDLRGFSPRLGVVDYLRKLEEVVIRACADFGVLTQRIPGRTGVWTIPGGTAAERKIAAFGVHFARGVTSHGFALNVTTDLSDFGLIVPCGIADRGVTSLEAEIDQTVHRIPSLQEAAYSVARQFSRVFARSVLWLESIEDLMANARPASGSGAAAGGTRIHSLE